jgi:hypothetical protein
VSDLEREAASFAVVDLGLVIEPAALAAARRSLDESGLLLLGEVHGVRENPLLIRSLMRAFGLGGLALEWDEDLMPAVSAFLAGEPLADHPLLWFGDGRITAGHLAVLRELAAAGPLSLGLFDGTIGADWDWSARDEAMAQRILAAPALEAGTLVVAGNAHTPTARSDLGLPLGAHLAGGWPGVREIRIRYGGGRFYNNEPRRFHRGTWRRPTRLHEEGGSLLLDLVPRPATFAPLDSFSWEAERYADSARVIKRRPGAAQAHRVFSSVFRSLPSDA